MSFRCENCGRPQPAGARPHKVVTERRERIYPEILDPDDPSVVLVPKTRGWEIVKEIEACDLCNLQMNAIPLMVEGVDAVLSAMERAMA